MATTTAGCRETVSSSKGAGLVRPRKSKRGGGGHGSGRDADPEGSGDGNAPRQQQHGDLAKKPHAPPRQALPKLAQHPHGEVRGEGGLLLKGSAAWTPAPRRPEWLAGGEVACFRLDGTSESRAREGERAHAEARQGRPVHLTGCPLLGKRVLSRWTFVYLSAAIDATSRTDSDKGGEKEGPPPTRKEEAGAEMGAGEGGSHAKRRAPLLSTDVTCSMDGRNRFFDLEVGKNVYGSHYHIREPESIPLEDVETFSEFASCAVKWREKHVQLNKVLMKRRVPSGTRVKDHLAAAMTPETMPDFCLSKTSSGAAEKERSEKSPCVARDLMNEVDWPWLFSFLRNQDLGSVRDVHLHCGTANSLHPCRYELCDTLITQVRGRTRFLLISPEHAFTGLYPYPVHHPYDRYSMVDFEADEDEIANLWPEFNAENVSGRECILEPGQALFVPECFFVHAQDLDAETVRLNLRVSRGRRLRSEAAVPLEVSRLLEERAAALASVREVHHWLSVVAHGEESDWIDTATVAGHRNQVRGRGLRRS